MVPRILDARVSRGASANSRRMATVPCCSPGNDGEWAFVPSESSADTFVFVRGAVVEAPAGKSKIARGKTTAVNLAATEELRPALKRRKAPASELGVPQSGALQRTTRQASASIKN